MHVELTFIDAVGLVVMLIGGAWALLKSNASQFNKGLDLRFSSQDEKLKHIDILMLDIKRVELETARRDSEYIGKFCTKDELRAINDRSERVSSQIFELLRHIDDKLDTKVNRDELNGCKAGQQ